MSSHSKNYVFICILICLTWMVSSVTAFAEELSPRLEVSLIMGQDPRDAGISTEVYLAPRVMLGFEVGSLVLSLGYSESSSESTSSELLMSSQYKVYSLGAQYFFLKSLGYRRVVSPYLGLGGLVRNKSVKGQLVGLTAERSGYLEVGILAQAGLQIELQEGIYISGTMERAMYNEDPIAFNQYSLGATFSF